MKNLISIVLITACIALTSACNDKNKHYQGYDDYRGYVITHRDSINMYYDKDWNELETGYNERKMAAEKDMDNWNDDMKAEYTSLQGDWDQVKEDYTAERSRRDMVAKTEKFRMALLPDGISGDMSNVTAANLLEVYKHFVDYTDQHKDDLTREDWDELKIMWERLGTRKNEVEKDLSSGDNVKIAGEKIRFGAMKAVNRPSAKAEENVDAKEVQK